MKKKKDYKRMLEIEKNAKNRAYYFILSSGLYDAFYLFCRTQQPSNSHEKCLSQLKRT